jgi:hypothetical protein
MKAKLTSAYQPQDGPTGTERPTNKRRIEMNVRKFSALCATSLLALSLLSAGSAAPASASSAASITRPGGPPMVIGPGEIFRIRLTNLHCNDANEESLFSDGDEPYVIVATIRPGGLAGPALDIMRTQVFDDVDDGDNRHPNLDALNRHVESSVAVVAQVVEHDDSAVALVFGTARTFAQTDFANAVLGGETNVTNLSAIVADAIRRGVDAARLPAVDDDDRIGSPARFTITTGSFDGLAVGGQPIVVTREVSGNDARYTMTFEVARTF